MKIRKTYLSEKKRSFDPRNRIKRFFWAKISKKWDKTEILRTFMGIRKHAFPAKKRSFDPKNRIKRFFWPKIKKIGQELKF